MIDEKKLNRGDLCNICRSADCVNCFSDDDFEKWIESQPKVENMYMSPITIMQGEMKMQLEGETMKAVAGYEIDIDKDELIKALNYDRQQYEKGYKDGLNKSNEWIPCDKHLPEDENEVLITVNGKFNNITFDNAIEIGFYNEVDGWIINGYLDWITPEVIAWMPLPRRGAKV